MMTNPKKILVTGAAGFIGFHLVKKMLFQGHIVIGLDNLNDYYDVNLKFSRLKNLGITQIEAVEWGQIVKSENFYFIKGDIENIHSLKKLFLEYKFDQIIHLAAQAGVRYSIENPFAYIKSNISGFINLLECCREFKINKFIYASSSSVYGNSHKELFHESDSTDHPISLYAATKKSNELMAYTYSHLYGIKSIGLRFFTVYGPWGRPDMAMYLFADSILNNRPINVFNNGELYRDFTYIDDIINGILSVMSYCDSSEDNHEIFNIGNNSPVKLLKFIEEIETVTNLKAIKKMLPMQPGDVSRTCADISSLQSKTNYFPKVTVKEGVSNYISWFKSYYNI
jgi:UDP-glucuronate 4-epimerase